MKLAIAGAAGFAINTSTPATSKAQGLGPFTAQNRVHNPLRAPIFIDSDSNISPALSDIDQDGDLDLIVSVYYSATGGGSMRTFQNFQVEYGLTKPTFMEVANPNLPYTYGSGYGTFIGSFIDIDGDGIEELASAPRYYHEVEILQNDNDGTGNFSLIAPAGLYIGPDYYTTSIATADMDGDGDLDLLSGSGEVSGLYFWENNGSNNFTLTPHGLTGYVPVGYYGTPAFFDIDGDSDVDLFVGEENGTVQFFRNQDFDDDAILNNNNRFVLDNLNPSNFLNGIDFGEFPTPRFTDIDLDGDMDLIIGAKRPFNVNDGYFNVFYNDGANNFTQVTGIDNPFGGVMGPEFDLDGRSNMTFGDLDNDGDMDMMMGAYDGHVFFYENVGSGVFERRLYGANPVGFTNGLGDTYTYPTMSDIDDDGDLDLIYGTNGSYQGLNVYLNTGTPATPNINAGNLTPNSLSTMISSLSIFDYIQPDFVDFDGDGDLDLITNGIYNPSGYAYLFTNNDPTTLSFTNSGYIGVSRSYANNIDPADIDHDGDIDLVIGSSGSGILEIDINDAGWSPVATNPFATFNASPESPSSRAAPETIDFDGDGDLDVFVGGQNGEVRFLQNDNMPVDLTLGSPVFNFTENIIPATGVSVTIDDPDILDNERIVGAFIKLNGFVPGEDAINFTNQFNITGSFNPMGDELTLTGSDSFANYQTALGSIFYQNTSEDPSTAARSLDYEVWDSDFTDPNLSSLTITVTPVNDPPVAVIGSGPISYTENDPGLNLDPLFSAMDVDHTNLQGGTISIAAHIPGEDQLLFTNQNGISGTYDDATGVLTLTGSSSVINYQTALQSVQFSNSSEAPNTSPRNLLFVLDDGIDPSIGVSQTITVTSVNDQPTITSSAPTTADELVAFTYTPTVVDPDDLNNGTELTWSISGEPAGMTIDPMGVVSWTPPLGSTTSGPVTISVSDGGENGTVAATEVFTLTVTNGNVAPTINLVATGDLDYTENDGPVEIDMSLTITDDSPDFQSATITLTGVVNTEDILDVTAAIGVSKNWNSSSGVLTLSGTATASEYEAMIQSLTYENTSDNPGVATRTVEIVVNDGFLGSTPVSRNVNVSAVNDPPIISLSSTSATYTENNAAITLDPASSILDPDNTSLSAASAQISANYQSGADQLNLTAFGSLTSSFDVVTGTLTISGSGTIAEYENSIRSLSFENTSEAPSTQQRTISIILDDGLDQSTNSSFQIAIVEINDPPSLSITSTDVDYTENSGPVVIGGISLTDDSNNQTQAVISISSGYEAGEDILGFTDQLGITGSFDGTIGALTLSGSASPGDYETALNSVTYENTSDDPSSSTRSLSVFVDDGSLTSINVSKNIEVNPVNDAPSLVGTAGNLTYRSLTGSILVDDQISISDPDDTNLSGAVVTVSGGYTPGEDILSVPALNGISGSFNSVTGTLTLSGFTTSTNYETSLSAIVYENLASIPSSPSKTISFEVSDSSLPSNQINRTIDVSDNQVVAAPLTVNTSVGSTSIFDVIGAGTVTAGDIITTSIQIAPMVGTAMVDANQAIIYNPNIDASGIDQITYEICNQFGSCGTNTISINIANDPPVFTPVTTEVEIQGETTIILTDITSDANNNIDPSTFEVISIDSDAVVTIDQATLELIIDYSSSTFKNGVDHIIIRVCDFSGLCTEEEIVIVVGDLDKILVYNAVTPNGDGIHDYLKLSDIELFPNNEIHVYTKIGSLVYNSTGYNNIDVIFVGIDNDGEELPNGTYYYVIELEEGKTQSGFFVLLR